MALNNELREAIETIVAHCGYSALSQELKNLLRDLRAGMPEAEAIKSEEPE